MPLSIHSDILKTVVAFLGGKHDTYSLVILRVCLLIKEQTKYMGAGNIATIKRRKNNFLLQVYFPQKYINYKNTIEEKKISKGGIYNRITRHERNPL